MRDIKAALTPEEWAQQEVETYDVMVYLDPGMTISFETDFINVPSELLHPIAALALYGQAFGFTREELMYLDSFAESGFMRPIADKIRALLPPEG